MIIIVLIFAATLTGCSYHSTAGLDDRFFVDTHPELFSPSVTIVTDTTTNQAIVFPGASIGAQFAAAAGSVAAGFIIGESLGKSRDNISVDNQNSGGTASTTQFQGQAQFQ